MMRASIVGACFGLAFMLSVSCGTDVAVSKNRAMDFANVAGFEVKDVRCQEYDSDENGYVTCTIFRSNDDPYSVECPAARSMNGCMSSAECRPASVKVSR